MAWPSSMLHQYYYFETMYNNIIYSNTWSIEQEDFVVHIDTYSFLRQLLYFHWTGKMVVEGMREDVREADVGGGEVRVIETQ